MIDKVNLKDVATYDSIGVEVNLKKINYIFGSNGTGKTTISEFLRNIDSFPSCTIDWKQNRSNYDLFVYNKNFVSENFTMRNEIKGIFTLGKESEEILTQIDEKAKSIDDHQERASSLIENIETKEEELESIRKKFTDRCWDLKQKYDEVFQSAFTGLRNNKERFMGKCFDEGPNNIGQLYTLEKLSKRVETVFRSSKTNIQTIPKVEYDNRLEKSSIFQTKIIGKKDIDIARLISELSISDWVQQGHKYIENSDGICPFCQQKLPVNFKKQLEDYFDETYTEQIHILEKSIKDYEEITIDMIDKYDYLKNEEHPFIDKARMVSLLERVDLVYKENQQILERKKDEPSRGIVLTSIMDYLNEINSEIEVANGEILKHNKIIENIKEEREQLIKDIWRFIVEENKKDYKEYVQNFRNLNKTVEGMKGKKQKLKSHEKVIRNGMIELQNQLTSILPSINEVNSLLKSFGITNFELAESGEDGNYKILRGNGEDAKETLSEGEKTFITFLYFYQLINGSNDQDKVNTQRIIVIDDPISSLDSNILFMVSNLINNLKSKVRGNDSNFKQLIILTHNVYFHKEISFNKGRIGQKLTDETFWILRKKDDITKIKEYDENPIKNSYELLWKELKENLNSITTPNIMRRILENYFNFFGNINVNKIVESFPNEEKVVCNTLLSWVNDGSHHVSDDLHISTNQEINEGYFEIFRKIFKNSNHESHFDMMMKGNKIEVEESTDREIARNEIQETVEQVASGRE